MAIKKTASKAIQESSSEDVDSLELIRSLKFCIFDLETTGGNHTHDKIIEVGLVKVENLEIVDRVDYLIQPEMKIPEFIQKLTSINQQDVEGAPIIDDVIDDILKFMGDSILVAHNTSFDVPFLNSVLTRLGREPLSNKALCTNLMTKYLIPGLMNSNLNYMSKIFDIKHHKAHRALDDALATADLLIIFLNIFIEKNIKKLNHLYYPRGRYELDVCHFKKSDSFDSIAQKIKNLKTSAVVTLKGENGLILFAFPLSIQAGSKKEEIDYILSKIKELDWEILSIKLHGPFIESLIHFSTLVPKIDITIRNEILRLMWKLHLPKQAIPMKEGNEEWNYPAKAIVEGPDFGDFLITHHIVPEQMIIYPIVSLNQHSELVFRYPGHKKKLLQYITSRSSRLNNQKMRKAQMNPAIKCFIDHYLIECKKSNDQMLIFDKNLALKNPNEFIETLEEFLTKTPNLFNYPKEYV